MSDHPNPPAEGAPGLLPLLILLAAFGLFLWLLLAAPRQQAALMTPEPMLAPTVVAAIPTATLVPTAEAMTVAYSPQQIENGRDKFLTLCTACHGQNGQGIQGLGKNLIVSEFMASLSDEELVQFIIVGRQPGDPLNTTGMLMPARGGNPSLTDAQIVDIVAYLRSAAAAQDLAVIGGAVQPQPQTNIDLVEEPFVMPGPVAAAASYAARDAAVVQPYYSAVERYNLSCAGCHGFDGQGVAGFGPSLFTSAAWGDGAALLALLTGDPALDAQGGFVHPVQGNLYPVMDTAALTELIGYLYSLQS
jgi:disulfide bond formation protein DsbB